MFAWLEKTKPNDGGAYPNKLDAYCFRWNNIGTNPTFKVDIGPKGVQTRTVNKGYLVSIVRKDNGPVTFHFARLPSSWIDGRGVSVQPWKIDLTVPTRHEWTWAICPARDLLAVSTLTEDKLCVCFNVLAIKFLLTVRINRSFKVELFKMSNGKYFYGPSGSKIEPLNGNGMERVDLLLTSSLLAAKTTFRSDDEFGCLYWIWDLDTKERLVGPFNPLSKTSRPHGSVEGDDSQCGGC